MVVYMYTKLFYSSINHARFPVLEAVSHEFALKDFEEVCMYVVFGGRLRYVIFVVKSPHKHRLGDGCTLNV